VFTKTYKIVQNFFRITSSCLFKKVMFEKSYIIITVRQYLGFTGKSQYEISNSICCGSILLYNITRLKCLWCIQQQRKAKIIRFSVRFDSASY